MNSYQMVLHRPVETALVFGNLLSPNRHRLDTQLVVDGVHDPLRGAKVHFRGLDVRGLDGAVSKQELNLLKLSTS